MSFIAKTAKKNANLRESSSVIDNNKRLTIQVKLFSFILFALH